MEKDCIIVLLLGDIHRHFWMGYCFSRCMQSANEIIPLRLFFSLHDELTEMLYGRFFGRFERIWKMHQKIQNISFAEFVKKCIESISRAFCCSSLLFTIYISLASLLPAAAVYCVDAYNWLYIYMPFMRPTENLNCNLIIHSHSQWVVNGTLAYNTALELTKKKVGRRWKKKVARRRSDKMLNNGVSHGSLRLPPIGIYKLAVAER